MSRNAKTRGGSTPEEARGADTQERNGDEHRRMDDYNLKYKEAKRRANEQKANECIDDVVPKNDDGERKKAPNHSKREAKHVQKKADGSQAVCPRTRRAGPMTLWESDAGVFFGKCGRNRKSARQPKKTNHLDVEMMRKL